MLTIRKVVGGALLLVLIGGGTIALLRWIDHKAQARAQATANQAAQEKAAYHAQAEALRVDLAAVSATAAAQAQELARLKARRPQILEAPKEGPDPCPELRELAVRQDGLIQTQDKALDLHTKREAALEGQISAAGRETQALQLQIRQMPVDRPWSVGPLVGVNLQGQLRLGVIASGSYRRVQGHALVLGDTVAAGLTWRFGGSR